MKKILILTDFSDNASHAAAIAVQLSLKVAADLLVYHSYNTNPMVPAFVEPPDDESGFSRVDGNRKRMRFLAGTLRLKIEDAMQIAEGPYHKVCTCFGEGDLGLNVQQLCRDYPVELIVMGSRRGSRLYRMFCGSDTASVINQAPVPVLVVPPNGELTAMNKILLATDFNKNDPKALSYLNKLATALSTEVGVVHIRTAGGEKTVGVGKAASFMQQLRKTNNAGVSFYETRGRDVLASLRRVCKRSGAGLLALVHRKRSFLSALLKKSVS